MNESSQKKVDATPDKKLQSLTTANQTSDGNFSNANKFCTPSAIRSRNGTFHTLPIVNTPTPPSRFRRIVNPFEAGLADRLHLPFIGSPSLFHRPPTPQLCSTQLDFEWTIDEVSSLNPANVEAHEAQFQSMVDPETEAKAQAAIQTFFKEQIIAPSPESCPLRSQKLLLTPQEKVPKKKRDGCSQTELTLPPNLPKELERALQPYFTYKASQQQLPLLDDDEEEIDHDERDASLRRKLFKAFNSGDNTTSPSEQEIALDSPSLGSPAPHTPELDLRCIRTKRFLTPMNRHNDSKSSLNISLSPVKKEEFGCISPISNNPTEPSENTDPTERSQTDASSFYISTPEKSSQPNRSVSFSFKSTASSRIESLSTDFVCESTKRKSFHLNDFETRQNSLLRSSSESNEDFLYDDEMQMSHSSYGSQQHPHTPTSNKSKRRKRSFHRKNLSLSFNSYQNDENMSVIEYTEAMRINTTEKTLGSESVGSIELTIDAKTLP